MRLPIFLQSSPHNNKRQSPCIHEIQSQIQGLIFKMAVVDPPLADLSFQTHTPLLLRHQ